MIQKEKNLGLDEIVSIEDMGMVDTYDFTIPKTHCFFANNILVHNTLEEHADVVFMLHWDYFYTRKEEDKNKYEIIVGKNRNGRTGKHDLWFIPEFYLFCEKGTNL